MADNDDARIVDRDWFAAQFDKIGRTQKSVGAAIGKQQNPMNSLMGGANSASRSRYSKVA